MKRLYESEDTVVFTVVPKAWDAAVEEEDEEGGAKVRYMVNVVDDHILASLFNDDGSLAINANLAVVGEHDVLVVDSGV